MKLLKWLLGTIAVLVLVVGVGVVALVYLVDWNDFKDTIQNQVKKQTGRDLQITGDLSPSVFPWAGISIGEISLANAEGFGETPFASIDSADVKVKLLPLIKREINVRTVELEGLQLDLQREADGTTNWDDLLKSTTTTTTTINDDDANSQVTTEVEGSSATIAALSVGGIEILDANVSWRDATTGTDAALSGFNLRTDSIELEKPFALDVDFSVASDSMDLTADVKGSGELMIDLDSQIYTVKAFTLSTDARGGAVPAGELSATLQADVVAMLDAQKVDVSSLKLTTLGLELDGSLNVENLDTEPAITGQFASNEFSPKQIFGKLGLEEPVTADESVLDKASLTLALSATPDSAALNELSIVLDDTRFTGQASVPSLEGAIPPVRFDFAVDAIDLDRYLPPTSEVSDEGAPADQPADGEGGGDVPIELPSEMMRQLDIDGTFRVGSVKVSNLTTSDIVIPVKASGGKLALQNMQAQLYEGLFNGTTRLDVAGETPVYGVQLQLDGIQADPLLSDLLQKDSFLSGGGAVAADITSRGNTVNQIMAGLNGQFNTAFSDGSINGINLGYQIRRAKAALSGQSLPAEEGAVKTDFSSLAVSGTFTDGIMQSDDLDMRSPLLRLGGEGSVDLPAESVDYTLTTLITGTAQGQGGADLASLKGVQLDIPIRGTFDELAANFAGVILSGMKDNITGNLKNQAKALADEKAAELKAQADELKAAKEAELKEKAEEVTSEAVEKARDKLKGLFK
ncbi:AsmA family protein [Granulosicoccus sp. 3-233]|uniref:AsmA family protein n=1 Tax=Granulosicoccus sp. 3-233 TaxID=3417969 RepID=UPI003D32FF81